MFVTFTSNRPTPNQYVALDPRCVASIEDTPSGTMIRYHNDHIFHVDASVQEVTAKLNDQLNCKVDTEPEILPEGIPKDWEDLQRSMRHVAAGIEQSMRELNACSSPKCVEDYLEIARQDPHYVFVNPAKVAEIIDRLRRLTTETEPKPSYERCMKILQDLNQLCEMLYV